ncbi:MAG: 2-hydroxychromene-2-carboxylate isomerase [Pseudomonadota bacterium]
MAGSAGHVDFWFDLSSPWTYLAFHNIQKLAAETGARIAWRPFLVGGVFNAVNASVYAGREDPGSPKMRHMFKSVKDWADWSGLALNFPAPHHPVRSVHAMRVCCALEADQPALHRFAEAAFAAYFVDQANLDEPSVLAGIADALGMDGAGLIAKTQDPAVKDHLKANTQAVIDLGGYGSPTIVVDGADMYFGNDQLPLVRRALERTG